MKMRYLKGWSSYNESADAQKFQYMMLGRLQTDCDYFLGNGQRSVNNLWGATIEEHIAEMKKIWNELEAKPEWLTMEQIEDYERQMSENISDVETIDVSGNGSMSKYIVLSGEQAKDNGETTINILDDMNIGTTFIDSGYDDENSFKVILEVYPYDSYENKEEFNDYISNNFYGINSPDEIELK